MMARPGAGGGGGVLGLVLLSWGFAIAAEPMPAEVRIRSTPAPLPTTTITLRVTPETVVEDHTVGAKPAAEGQGMASTGDTFRDEVHLFLSGFAVSRPTVVEVSDDLVSMVRVLPEDTGTTVIVFVRQPLLYTVTKPSAAGEIVIALKGRPVPPRRHAQPATPAAGAGGEEQIAVDAEQVNYDQHNDVVVARGAVTITKGAVTLRADEVRYDRKTSIADATGNVVITDPETTLEGSSARIDMNDESGWMEAATGDFSRTGYSLTSRHLEKGIGPRYIVDDGVFTTCRCGGVDKPSWSIGGSRTDVKLNGIGIVRNATFRVKDVPVLWFPILPFPTLTDRATGFLMPQVAYSNRRGFVYQQPFFWNISKSQDATVALDVETSARIGILGEYRYMLSQAARGTIAGGYWNESFRSVGADEVLTSSTPTGQTPVNRWLALGRVVQPLGDRRQAYMDAFAVSDDNLLREIHNFSSTLDTGLRMRSARLTKTRAGAIQTWDRGLVQAEADYYQDLIDPQVLAPQRAPNLRAEHAIPFLDNRVVGRLAGTVTNFQRNEGFDGFRGDLAPELFLPFNVGRYLNGSVLGRVHGTLYQLANDQQVALVVPTNTVAQSFRVAETPEGKEELAPLDPTHLRGVPEVRARLATEIARVYDFPHFGLQKLRHSIEPVVNYLYVPKVDQNLDQTTLRACSQPACLKFSKDGTQCLVPNPNYGVFCNATLFSRGYLFDELDAINKRNFFSYGFTTRLLGRWGGTTEPTPPPPTSDTDADEEWDDGSEDNRPTGVGEELASGGATTTSRKPAAPAPAVKASPTKELLRFTALHGFDVSRDINTDSHQANLDLGLRLTPLDYLSFTYEASMNVSGSALDAQSATLVLREPNWVASPRNVYQSPSMLLLSYRFVEENVNVRGNNPLNQQLFSNFGTQNAIGGVYLRLGDYFGASFGALYDLNGGQIVNENGRKRTLGPHFILRDFLFRVISPCNCWAAEFGVSDNFDTNETLFSFRVTLLGLGSFGQGSPTGRYYGIAPLPSLGIRNPSAIGGSTGYF